MAKDTEQKILDAALKIFSKNGYVGARTRIIAKESGFTEMTLFRKFETKENLFNQVLITNQERIVKDFDALLKLNETDGPEECFKALVNSIVDLVDENFSFVNILVYERERIPHSVIRNFIFHLAKHLENMFPNKNINYDVLSFNILSFIYFIIFSKYMGDDFFNKEKSVEEFIKYNSSCLKQ